MNKLKAKVIEREMSMSEFFEQTGIGRDVWYRRCRKGPGAFHISEVTAKGLDLFKRKMNKAIRYARGRKTQMEAVEQNKRHRDIRTEGRTREQVFNGVQRQSGIDSIMTYEEWARSALARRAATGAEEDSQALASLEELGYYYSYLTGLGLTPAETEAIMRAQSLTRAVAETYNESKA